MKGNHRRCCFRVRSEVEERYTHRNSRLFRHSRAMATQNFITAAFLWWFLNTRWMRGTTPIFSYSRKQSRRSGKTTKGLGQNAWQEGNQTSSTSCYELQGKAVELLERIGLTCRVHGIISHWLDNPSVRTRHVSVFILCSNMVVVPLYLITAFSSWKRTQAAPIFTMKSPT